MTADMSLETLRGVNGRLEAVATALEMLAAGALVRTRAEFSFKGMSGIRCQTVWENGGQVIIGQYQKRGARCPEHRHPESREWLIVTAGSFRIRLYQEEAVCHAGGSVIVPINEAHWVESLEDNSSIIAVCVPLEQAYRKGMNGH